MTQYHQDIIIGFTDVSFNIWLLLMFQTISSINHWISWCLIQYHHYIIGSTEKFHSISLNSMGFDSIYNWIPWYSIHYHHFIIGFIDVSFNIIGLSGITYMQCILGFSDISFNIINKSLVSLNVSFNSITLSSGSLMFHSIRLNSVGFHSIYYWIPWCFIQDHQYIIGFIQDNK